MESRNIRDGNLTRVFFGGAPKLLHCIDEDFRIREGNIAIRICNYSSDSDLYQSRDR